jgi:hypothetical protein
MNEFLIFESVDDGSPVLINFQYVTDVRPVDPSNPKGPSEICVIHGQTPFVVTKSISEIFAIMQGRILIACRRIIMDNNSFMPTAP